MKVEFLLNFKSLLKHKTFFNIKINSNKNRNYKIIRVKNLKYNQSNLKIKIPKFKKHNFLLLSKSSITKEMFPIKIKFSHFLYFILKFEIKNEYVISNINKIFFVFEQLLDKFNYNFPNYHIEKNINNIFKIISYNEDLLNESIFENFLKDLENFSLFINKEISSNIKLFKEVEDEK